MKKGILLSFLFLFFINLASKGQVNIDNGVLYIDSKKRIEIISVDSLNEYISIKLKWSNLKGYSYNLDDVFVVQNEKKFQALSADFNLSNVDAEYAPFIGSFKFQGGWNPNLPFNLIEQASGSGEIKLFNVFKWYGNSYNFEKDGISQHYVNSIQNDFGLKIEVINIQPHGENKLALTLKWSNSRWSYEVANLCVYQKDKKYNCLGASFNPTLVDATYVPVYGDFIFESGWSPKIPFNVIENNCYDKCIKLKNVCDETTAPKNEVRK